MWHASSTLVDVAFGLVTSIKRDLCCATNSAGLDGKKTAPYGIFRTALFLFRHLLDIYSLHFALMNSRFRRAMLLNEMFFGHSASTCTCVGTVAESEFVHFLDHCAGAAEAFHLALGKGVQTGLPLALTNTCIAEPFLQAATQAPQPIHVAESIASSATSFDMGVELAPERPPQLNDTYPPACCIWSNALRLTVRSRITGNAAERQGSMVMVSPSLNFAHVELACGDALYRTVGMSVDVQRWTCRICLRGSRYQKLQVLHLSLQAAG